MGLLERPGAAGGGQKKQMPAAPIGKDLRETVAEIRQEFGSSDLMVNDIKMGTREDCAGLYLKGLADEAVIDSLSLELTQLLCTHPGGNRERKFDLLASCFSGMRTTRTGTDREDLCRELLDGNTVFLLDGCGSFLAVATSSNEGRAVNEPTSQTIIKGPKDAFTENIEQNVYLIRKRIKNKALRVENLAAGDMTHTALRLLYLNGVAKGEIVQEIRSRLSRIKIDRILEGNYIEEFLRDDKYTLFPEVLNSEKPDSVAAALLEGRVAVLVDGTPYVLTAPALAVEFLQVSEDYYHHFVISSFLRVLRLLAFFLTLLVPAVYIALTTFHQEIIPTQLLISIAAQREGVPFPAFLEVLLMEVIFEILREAGIRMPRAIGSAISIVGALVLGQAAVEAGLISAAVVIVVSITAIASFAIPNYAMANAVRLVRFALIFLSGMLGLYGISIGLLVLTLHLCKLKSITVPYLTPIAPRKKDGNHDTIFRFPLWNIKGEPTGIAADGVRRDVKRPAGTAQKGKPEFGA